MTTKEVFIIVLATFITFSAWVAFDIVHKATKSTVSEKLQQVIEPIDPNFDSEAINLLP